MRLKEWLAESGYSMRAVARALEVDVAILVRLDTYQNPGVHLVCGLDILSRGKVTPIDYLRPGFIEKMVAARSALEQPDLD
jgi:hypothetical protein